MAWEVDQPFDAIYEQTSSCSLHPDKCSDYEKCLYKWLKPNGKLFAQFMQTGQKGSPPFHCDIIAMRNLFVSERWIWSEPYETKVVHSVNMYEEVYFLEKA